MGKVIVDTNIFAAAYGWKGKPRKIVQAAVAEQFILIMPSQQLDELHRVLYYEEFNFMGGEKEDYLSIIESIANIISVPGTLRLVRHDVDNALLEAAAITVADYIITGDKELLALGRYHHTAIVTPETFLKHNR